MLFHQFHPMSRTAGYLECERLGVGNSLLSFSSDTSANSLKAFSRVEIGKVVITRQDFTQIQMNSSSVLGHIAVKAFHKFRL